MAAWTARPGAASPSGDPGGARPRTRRSGAVGSRAGADTGRGRTSSLPRAPIAIRPRPTQPMADFSRDPRSQWQPSVSLRCQPACVHESGLGPPGYRPWARPAPNALRQGRTRGARARGGKGIPGPDPPRGGLGAGRAGREPHFHPGGPLPSPPCPPAHGARLGAAARAGPR